MEAYQGRELGMASWKRCITAEASGKEEQLLWP